MFIYLDPPGAPGAPRCVETTEDSITVQWSKPRHDGGSPITGYVVEKRLTTDDKWTKASHAIVPDLSLKYASLVGNWIEMLYVDYYVIGRWA